MLIFILGFLAGILSGLSVGGGTLLVPALVLFGGIAQQTAQGVNLLAFIPAAVVAVITHYLHGNVKVKLALYLICGTMIGAALGSYAAVVVSSALLRKLFGVFLIVMGIYEFFGKQKEK